MKLHDSHAEVLARRGAIRVLMDRDCSLIDNSRVKEGVQFHLYISRAPCGDASQTELAQEVTGIESSHLSLELMRGRNGFGLLNALRTKPGRRDAESTTSLSCSDKLAQWTCLGFGGAVISERIGPIYFNSIIVGALFDEQQMRRSLIDRISDVVKLPLPYRFTPPRLYGTSLAFKYDRLLIPDGKPSDICFIALPTMDVLEVYVNGYFQGSKFPSPKIPVISRQGWLKAQENSRDGSYYKEMKLKSETYQVAKRAFTSLPAFSAWSHLSRHDEVV
jgi:hypothetical protein